MPFKFKKDSVKPKFQKTVHMQSKHIKY